MKDYKEEYKNKINQLLQSYDENYGLFLKERYKKYKHVCIWGVGNMGRGLPQILKKYDIEVDCYCDNDKSKIGMDVHNYGIRCISLEDLMKVKDETAVIVPTRYYKEIYQQLKELGFPVIDRIFHAKFIVDDFLNSVDISEVILKLQNTIDLLADEESCRVLTRLVEEWTRSEYHYGQLDDICSLPQYFPRDFMEGSSDEVFVDCGAYNGDNIQDFIDFEKGEFKRYYAFELNKKNYEELKDNVHNSWLEYEDKFVLENKGISDATMPIMYTDACEGSKVNGVGTEKGYVVSIDDYFSDLDEKVSFIKMDIEGAEMDALKGAMITISMSYPKLAICIYHKPEDFWEIPLFIKKNWNEYKIFIRHHTELTTETVCYAIKGSDND